MHLLEVAQLWEDAEPDEEEVDHPRHEQRHREVDDVVVEPPRVVDAQHLAPGDQDHDDDQAEVVEAGEADETGDDEHERGGDEDGDRLSREPPDDRRQR